MNETTFLSRVVAIADEWKLAALQPQIAACRELVHRNNGIEVAVLGRFKAGKSSFLNHLAGRAVLPIGVVPLTAVITRLRYGERERAEVRFLDGGVTAVPLGDIGLYVSENENPNNAKHVAAVEVALPELKPLAPLEFVDTPGLGSAFAHNTEVALNWLPQVGAALVAVGSDAPLSERDLALLEDLRRHTPTIGLLLTKADLLTEPQREEVLAFVRQQLKAKWHGGLPVFFYSIKPELAAMKAALLTHWLEPLRQNKDQAGGQILRHKLASLRDHTLNYLRVALAAATQAESARDSLRETLAEERRRFGLLRSELNVFAREQSANALDSFLTQLHPTQTALQAKLTAEWRAQCPRWTLRLPPLLEAWREWVHVFLNRELTDVSQQHRAVFCWPLQQAQVHLTRTLQAFHDRLAGHVKSALGVTLTPREFTLEVRAPQAPPVNVAYAFDAAFTTVGWLIPLTLFRRPIERVLLRKARYEVAKNLSRLAAAWRDRVGLAIEDLRRQTESAARNELEALEQMLEQLPSDVPRLRAEVEELEALGRAGMQPLLVRAARTP